MKRFQFVRGSDLTSRDGMYLELWDVDEKTELAEVFYSDETRQMTFTAYRPFEIPLEVIECLFEHSKKLLPPLEGSNEGENPGTLER